MITVVNRNKHTPQPMDFYIGRGSPLGNPYTHIKSQTKLRKGLALYYEDTLEEVLQKYEKWLLFRLSDKKSEQHKEFYRLVKFASTQDINLVCYCAPKRCHGDYIKKLIENLLFPNA